MLCAWFGATQKINPVEIPPEYDAWFNGLRGMRAQNRIDGHLRRLSLGNAGDAKFFDVILLYGGDKSTQPRDIRKAMGLAEKY